MSQISTRGAGADDRAVAVEAGVLAQAGRDRDPALLVGHLVGGAGEEHAQVVAGRLAGHRGLAHLLGDRCELVHREDVEAALLPSGDHEAARPAVAELRGQEQPALVVEAGCVGAEEHGPPPPPRRPARRPPSPALRCPTVLHFPPPSTHDRAILRRRCLDVCAGQRAVERSGADAAARDRPRRCRARRHTAADGASAGPRGEPVPAGPCASRTSSRRCGRARPGAVTARSAGLHHGARTGAHRTAASGREIDVTDHAPPEQGRARHRTTRRTA